MTLYFGGLFWNSQIPQWLLSIVLCITICLRNTIYFTSMDYFRTHSQYQTTIRLLANCSRIHPSLLYIRILMSSIHIFITISLCPPSFPIHSLNAFSSNSPSLSFTDSFFVQFMFFYCLSLNSDITLSLILTSDLSQNE